MKLALFISILTLVLISPFAIGSDKALTYTEIYDLKNPYTTKSTDESLLRGSEEYIRVNAMNDRFEQCQGYGMIAFVGLAHHMGVMAEAGYPQTKFEGMKYMADSNGLSYPFDAEEISSSTMNRVIKLAIEIGSDHPGSADEHIERIASIFWNKCLSLPITFFEEVWAS